MIFWEEYKRLKIKAERLVYEGSKNDYIQIECLKYKLHETSYKEAIENIIDVLSDGRHKNPL